MARVDPDATAVLPETLTFTPFAWNALQTVTVTGVEDSDTDDARRFS